MSILTVAARDVQPGDEVYYAAKGSNPDFHWHRVKAVRTHADGTVIIETVSFDTWKHPSEGVAIRRLRDAQLS